MKKTALLIGYYYKDLLNLLPENITDNLSVILSKNNPKEVNISILKNNINSEIISNQDELISCLHNINPEIIISIGWRKILDNSFFEHFKGKMLVNIHPAILPQYKGFHSEPYVIFNNEEFHGITAHFLEPDIDSGKIILQDKFAISRFSSVKSIKFEVEERMPKFFATVIEILNSEIINPSPQIGETKIIAPKRTPEDSEIDPNKSIISLFNTIRAFDPENYPAFFYIEGEKVFIKLWTERTNKKPFEL